MHNMTHVSYFFVSIKINLSLDHKCKKSAFPSKHPNRLEGKSPKSNFRLEILLTYLWFHTNFHTKFFIGPNNPTPNDQTQVHDTVIFVTGTFEELFICLFIFFLPMQHSSFFAEAFPIISPADKPTRHPLNWKPARISPTAIHGTWHVSYIWRSETLFLMAMTVNNPREPHPS